MAFNPLSGYQASVTVGATAMAFDKWEVELSIGLPKVTNFTSSGAQVLVKGIYKARIRLSGPYDQGNMAITLGNSYSFTLTYTTGVSLIITAFVESITPSVSVEDAERMQIVAQSSGTFSAAIT